MLIDFEQILAIEVAGKGIRALSDRSALLLSACSVFLHNRSIYGDVDDDMWQEIESAVGEALAELINSLVGMIIPSAFKLSDLSTLQLLECDGSTHNRADYPLLYEAIDTVFILDADTFFVPDLREKFVMGASAIIAVGDSGGENSVTLSEAQIPAHTHGNLPHTHGEIGASPAFADLGTGVPVPSAVPAPSSTSPSSIVIENAGGSQAHENRPSFVALRYVMVAG